MRASHAPTILPPHQQCFPLNIFSLKIINLFAIVKYKRSTHKINGRFPYYPHCI